MEWNEFSSVELPLGAQLGDLLSVSDQLEKHALAVLEKDKSKRLESAPQVKALAVVVQDALEELIEKRDALRTLESQREETAPVVSKEDAFEAKTVAADGWRSIEKVIDAGRTLRDDVRPGQPEAIALHERLFSAYTMRFLTATPRRYWDTASRLMLIVEEPESIATIEAIGGARALAAVRASHEAFGLAYGFLAARELAPEAVTDTRDEQSELRAAIKAYVHKVSAQVTRSDPSSGALSRFLLAPYAELVADLESVRSPKFKVSKE